MPSASHTEVFNCTPKEFYKVVSDYEKYPQFLSEVKECKIVKKDGERKLVEYKVSVIKTFSYQLWMSEKDEQEISWALACGDIFKTSTGSWKLSPAGADGGKCQAVYSVDATFGMFVPGPIAKTLLSVNLPSMMASYHKRIKELYGK